MSRRESGIQERVRCARSPPQILDPGSQILLLLLVLLVFRAQVPALARALAAGEVALTVSRLFVLTAISAPRALRALALLRVVVLSLLARALLVAIPIRHDDLLGGESPALGRYKVRAGAGERTVGGVARGFEIEQLAIAPGRESNGTVPAHSSHGTVGLEMPKSPKSVPVIVETPKGARSKLAFDYELGMLRLTRVLPAGFAFPFNFGSIPGTRADDGDPLDILLLMDEQVPAGTLVEARPIGVLEAEQIEEDVATRNDRLVGVACESSEHRGLSSARDFDPASRKEFERFFEAYNAEDGKEFHGLGWFGPKRAWRLIQRARKKAQPPKTRSRSPQSFADYAAAARKG
jgi:inorganic pyrophosphatase